MKKFLCLFFMIFSTVVFSEAQAAIRSIVSPIEAEQIKNSPKPKKEKRIVVEYKSIEDVIEDRADKVFVSTMSEDEANNSGGFGVSVADGYIDKIQEKTKPFFQRVFEEAVNRVSNEDKERALKKEKNLQEKRDIERKLIEQQTNSWEKNNEPNFPNIVINIEGESVRVPALEHIPYFSSDISVLADGTAKIKEKIIVIANGQQVVEGISRIIPKKTVARNGKVHNIDINLISVKLDEKYIEHTIKDLGNLLTITPTKKYALEPGVYSYEFNYIVARSIWEYDDFNEFYWNINGHEWNLVITKMGASIKFPGIDPNAGATSFITKQNQIDIFSTKSFKNEDREIIFTSTRPIFPTEGMQILSSIDKSLFTPVDISKKTSWFITDYGDVILSSLALIAIMGSYFLSWIFISNLKNKNNLKIKQNPMILRFLLKNIFDKKSFVAYLLDLYANNIIDIKKEENHISLVKLTDNSKKMSRNEKKALNNLFLNNESSINLTKNNLLKINRAYLAIKEDTQQKIKSFMLKANLGYISFSFGMLLLSQFGISMLHYSYLRTFSFMVFIDIVMIFSITIFIKNIRKKIVSYLVKAIAVILVFFSILFSSLIMNVVSAFIILASIITIYSYSMKLSKRNGLIRHSITEATNNYKYLVQNIETVSQTKIFIDKQADIFATELEEKYLPIVKDKDYNKLEIAKDIEDLIA